MNYLTVGTNEIKRELFIPVKDNEKNIYKPKGGLWFTKYEENYANYNEWVDYLINNPDAFFYKNRVDNIWEQPCSLVTLRANANIFMLENKDEFTYLKREYPLDTKIFSYELLAHKYDGIYVDVLKLIRNTNDDVTLKMIRQFAVSSLVLFNIDCIDYYQSGHVLIKPFDLEYYMYESTEYKIEIEKVKKKVR